MNTASLDIASAILRVTVGGVMLAHGWNHVWGGGKLAGTTRWFASIGMRPARLHAVLASWTELGGGAFLVVGLLTPLAAGSVVGTMGVAFVANHRRNGFFIFRKGEGYEYVMVLSFAALAIASLGGGALSLDRAIGFDVNGYLGLALAAATGWGGAALVLLTSWRRQEPSGGGA